MARRDLGFSSPTPDPYAQLERIAPYAVTAQVKVMTKVNGEDTPADYARLVKILREANYRGYLIFEYEEDEIPTLRFRNTCRNSAG